MKRRRNLIAVMFGLLPTVLLAADFANSTNEYQSGTFPAGWVYQWNGNGSIADTNNYVDLNADGASYYTEDSSRPNSAPGDWLSVGKTSTHPGRGNYGGYDYYAIRGRTVSQSGPLYVYGGVNTPNASPSDGTTVRLSVGNSERMEFLSPPGTSYPRLFCKFIGEVTAGETVYVSLGPNSTDFNDSTTLYFRLGAPAIAPSGVVADYTSDFRGPVPNAGWLYLYNETGAIGDPVNYEPLEWSTEGLNRYSPANDAFPTGDPGRYLFLNSGGGHAGSSPPDVVNDVYAIAAFTVPEAGRYDLVDAWLTASDENNPATGVALYVHVNDDAPLIDNRVVPENNSTTFDMTLGDLEAGDTVYVCAGPNGNWTGGSGFTWDFNVKRIYRGTLVVIE